MVGSPHYAIRLKTEQPVWLNFLSFFSTYMYIATPSLEDYDYE